MYLFEGLKEQVAAYLPDDQVAEIQRAYVVAKDAHDGQMRSSGEPYITHPVAVTRILAVMKLDHETLMAALLHDVIEDTEYSKDDLAELFGATVAELVEGVSKLDKIKFSSKEEAQAENFRKMMMAMVQDIRVILIKLADRTHNMRTLGALRPDKRRRIARETIEIYAPIAHRLGIHDVKNELEDLGFKALYPMRYRALGEAVRVARGNRKEILDRINREIVQRLEENDIQPEVKGREKHLYSIYRKMKNKELNFNEVMDIYAFRVLVKDLKTCYHAFGVIHNLYKPIEGRFKDYIAIPRTNGYQSLHTSLVGPHGIPVEVQIRTHDMDQMADKGVAAHWLYKQDNSDSTGTTAQVRARRWMQSLLELQQSAASSHEFIENVKTDLFPDEIYVFTPDGRIIELPMGATAIDFAYAVHTDVGNTCVGARVERKPYSLHAPLENGQTIEIITTPGAKPNANWLNFVVSSKARMHIRQYLKKQESEDAIALGTRLLRHALGTVKLEHVSQDSIDSVLKDNKFASMDELLKNIGLGNIMSIMVARRLLGDEQEKDADAEPGKKRTVAIKGAEGVIVSYARCCYPIPGDQITAHVSPGKGLVIHQVTCRNIKGHENESNKYLPVKWDEDLRTEFNASVRIEMINHQGTLARLTSIIANCDSNIVGLQTEEKDSNLYFIDIVVTIKDRVHLAEIMRKIRVIPEVQKVSRYTK